MTLDQALRLSAVILATSGFTALMLAGEVPLGLFLSAYGCAGASAARALGWGVHWRIFRLSGRTWNTLIILALLACAAELFWSAPGLLQASVHFLIVLMINKLLTLRERKDYLQLYALSLLAILATAALTVELWYASITAVFLLAAVWSLMLSHLAAERHELHGGDTAKLGWSRDEKAQGPMTSRLFWTTNAIGAAGLCLTVAIFFLTPRVGAGLFQKQRVDLIRTSGFSDRVDLGVIGAIKLDQTVVMRVELPDVIGQPTERLYFRGAAYDRYNGRSWANSFPHRHTINRDVDGAFKVDSRHVSKGAAEGLRQEVLIEALDTTALFGAPFIHSLEGNFFLLQTDGMGAFYLPNPPATRLQYTVYSSADPLAPVDRLATSHTYPDEIMRHYLQLPPASERVRALAQEVIRPAKTVFEQVTTIQRHLRTAYRYSLDVGTAFPSNPMDEFLFVRKSGYCEHYATAMVLMLRSLGIPARLVTGFLHGEWNDFGNYYTVRQRDAHAWVEAYFPRSGWRTFDPTPMAGVGTVMPAWSQTVRLMDSIRLKWDRLVIRYSLRDQVLVVRGLRERGEQVKDYLAGDLVAMRRWLSLGPSRLAAFIRSDRSLQAGLLVAGVLIGTAIIVLLFRVEGVKRRRTAGGRGARQVMATRLYNQMLAILDRLGFSRSPGTTPLEFARHISRQSASLGETVHRLTALYCQGRFGRDGLSPEDCLRADEMLRKLSGARPARHPRPWRPGRDR